MIICEAAQGTQEWHDSRLGKPSASMFASLVTSTGTRSQTANNYINKMIAQRITGRAEAIHVTDAMARGTELEPEARATYEFETGFNVQEVGFVMDDSEQFGASPDGLIYEAGSIVRGVEIKCPSAHVHVEWLRKGKLPVKHLQQVQGGMMLTGCAEWDFYSYHPDIDPLRITVQRDELFIGLLRSEVERAVAIIASETQKIISGAAA